jgi:hypothetical protein
MWHDWQRRTLLRGSFALAVAGLLPKAAPAATEASSLSDDAPAERERAAPPAAEETPDA